MRSTLPNGRNYLGASAHSTRRTRWLAVLASVALLSAATACGSSDASSDDPKPAANCSGEQATVYQLVDLSGGTGQSPEVGDGMRAAVAAGNAVCAGGRPVKLVQCDTKLNPNTSLDCARKAIADKAVATIGNFPVAGESARTVLNEAGIPDLFASGVFPSELKNSLSFPLGARALLVVAGVDAAAGTGVTSYMAVAPDVGAPVEQALGLAKVEADKLGLTSKDPVIVPLDATDYSSYVAQAQATGADAYIAGFTATGMSLFLNALADSSVDLTKTKVIATGSSVTQEVLNEHGDRLDGLYLFGDVPSVSDTSNPTVDRYLSDLASSEITTGPTGGGLSANIAGHAFLQVIKDLPAVSSESIVEAMGSFVLEEPGAPKVDFSQPGFPSDPVLSTLRLFNNQQAYYQVVDGQITPVSDGFVPLGAKPTFSSK